MSNVNKVFFRGESPRGTSAQYNAPRGRQRSNPQRCRRQMRTEQQAPPAGEIERYEAGSLTSVLSVLAKKCQTIQAVHSTGSPQTGVNSAIAKQTAIG